MLETEEKKKSQPTPPQEKEVSPGVPPESSKAAYAGEDEIDLGELMQQVWARRKTLLYTILVTFLLGIFVAAFSPEEYRSSIVLLPQTDSPSGGINMGILRQFGGLAGLGVGTSASGTISTSLYPDITQSTPFLLHMTEEEFYFSTLDTTVSLAQYFSEIEQPGVLGYAKKYTLGLPGQLISLPANLISSFKNKPRRVLIDNQAQSNNPATDTAEVSLGHQPITITGTQLSVINELKSRITTSIEENGTVKVEVEMPDPMVAATATEMAVKFLTNYVLEFRTEKAQQDLAFVEKQYNEKKDRYNAAQQQLARFQDRNTNIFTQSAQIELERLNTENNLAFNLYQSLAQQLEQAKIKVQEETPIFKVLEPIQVPLSISKPNRALIITLSLFAGIFLGLGIIFLQILYTNFKSKTS